MIFNKLSVMIIIAMNTWLFTNLFWLLSHNIDEQNNTLNIIAVFHTKQNHIKLKPK